MAVRGTDIFVLHSAGGTADANALNPEAAIITDLSPAIAVKTHGLPILEPYYMVSSGVPAGTCVIRAYGCVYMQSAADLAKPAALTIAPKNQPSDYSTNYRDTFQSGADRTPARVWFPLFTNGNLSSLTAYLTETHTIMGGKLFAFSNVGGALSRGFFWTAGAHEVVVFVESAAATPGSNPLIAGRLISG